MTRTVALRVSVWVLVLTLLLIGPVAQLLLGIEDPRFRTWTFAAKAPPICEVTFVGATEPVTERRRRIEGSGQVSRFLRGLCRQNPEARVSVHCATRRGWKSAVTPKEDPCSR